MTIDLTVLADARRQLETAARRLRQIEDDSTHDAAKTARRLSEALANIDAAKARLT